MQYVTITNQKRILKTLQVVKMQWYYPYFG